jgi:hypothetical protein
LTWTYSNIILYTYVLASLECVWLRINFPLIQYHFSAFTVETLRQLIFRDLEDGWSHSSDGTPTNEAANERSPFNDHQRPLSSETLLGVSPSQWEAEHAEAPPSEVECPSVLVVRKGKRGQKI